MAVYPQPRAPFQAVLCLITALLLFSPAVARAEKLAEVTTDGFVKVYKGPSKKATVIAFAKKGVKYPVLMEGGEWVKIRYIKTEGWIERGQLKFTAPVEAEPTLPAPTHPALPPPIKLATQPAPQGHITPAAAPLLEQSSPAPPPAVVPPSGDVEIPVPKSQALEKSTQAMSQRSLLVRETELAQQQAQYPPMQFRRQPSPLPKQSPDLRTQRMPQPGSAPRRKALAPEANQAERVRIVKQPVVQAWPAEKKFAQVTAHTLTVYSDRSNQSRILGYSSRGECHRILDTSGTWLKIAYYAAEGWIQREQIIMVDNPQKHRTTAYFVPALFTLLAASAAMLPFMIRRRMRRKKSALHNALILGNVKTFVRESNTRKSMTLQRCFSKIAFDVRQRNDARGAEEQIIHHPPDVLLVDWRLSPDISPSIETLFSSHPSLSNVIVIFFNAPDPAGAGSHKRFNNFHYLGASFTDREIFRMIAPLSQADEETKIVLKSAVVSAIEGEVSDESLSSLLQLVDIGHKTGCIVVQDPTVAAVIYFEQGMITYASTRRTTGRAAIYEILNMRKGHFSFLAGTRSAEKNCSIPVMGIIMEWAQKKDEERKSDSGDINGGKGSKL